MPGETLMCFQIGRYRDSGGAYAGNWVVHDTPKVAKTTRESEICTNTTSEEEVESVASKAILWIFEGPV